MRAGEAFDRLLSVFFPKVCFHCGRAVAYEQVTCGECKPDAPEPPLCARCGHTAAACSCRESFAWAFSKAVHALRYRDRAREAVLRLKTKPDPRICAFFAQEMERAAHEQFTDLHFDFVTEVPSSRRKLDRKGYNQAELIASALGAQMMLHHSPRVILQADDAATQHELDYAARFENAAGAFSVIRKNVVPGKRVLLVDDVFTTGATAHYCARSLMDAGAREVCVLTATGTDHAYTDQKTLD